MENRIADKVSSLPVYVNEEKKGDKLVDSRILSATKQPLINYYAIYLDDGKPRDRFGRPVPVLQMLQTKPIGAPLYDKPLKKENPVAYLNDLRALDAGIIPTDLRKIFADLNPKVDLSAGARVVDQYRYSWLITDQGRAFYVEATPPPGGSGAWTLKISNAELELIYSDLTAVITGPNAARFALSNTSTTFRQIPASPDRRQPYREYTIIYHQAFFAAQAFSAFYNANLQNVILAGADNFAINYGSGAIGPEVIANRLGVGPMGNKDSVDLKFEEFFLSAWAVGDPAMVVDHPANATERDGRTRPTQHRALEKEVPEGRCTGNFGTRRAWTDVNPPPIDDFAPLPNPPVKATKAFFPDDPSNVYHSYMNDHVKFRILHAGAGPSHVHHLHAHQWLRSPDSDSSSYLDSQLIVPGSAFTLEITYNGSGNRNKTVGDSIFHCHFYPHFAQGMWALWRVHDVFEEGTMLEADGKPKTGVNRALPDGEIIVGTPIPAIVPLPTLAMAPMPAKVELTDLAPLTGRGRGKAGVCSSTRRRTAPLSEPRLPLLHSRCLRPSPAAPAARFRLARGSDHSPSDPRRQRGENPSRWRPAAPHRAGWQGAEGISHPLGFQQGHRPPRQRWQDRLRRWFLDGHGRAGRGHTGRNCRDERTRHPDAPDGGAQRRAGKFHSQWITADQRRALMRIPA